MQTHNVYWAQFSLNNEHKGLIKQHFSFATTNQLTTGCLDGVTYLAELSCMFVFFVINLLSLDATARSQHLPL